LRQDLRPIPKFVLTVLGDAANEQGVCWPRIATIAEKVGVSPRTVQRAVQHLVERELITVEQRNRSDGSCSSNLYKLLLERGDSLSPAPDRSDTTPGHPCRNRNRQIVVVERFLICITQKTCCHQSDPGQKR